MPDGDGDGAGERYPTWAIRGTELAAVLHRMSRDDADPKAPRRLIAGEPQSDDDEWRAEIDDNLAKASIAVAEPNFDLGDKFATCSGALRPVYGRLCGRKLLRRRPRSPHGAQSGAGDLGSFFRRKSVLSDAPEEGRGLESDGQST